MQGKWMLLTGEGKPVKVKAVVDNEAMVAEPLLVESKPSYPHWQLATVHWKSYVVPYSMLRALPEEFTPIHGL